MKLRSLFIAIVMSFMLGIGSLSTAGTRIYVKITPPAPKKVVVVKKNRPHKNAFWVKGHWKWNGRKYVWVKGHWQTPRKGFVWVPGHWAKNRHGWYWIDGHWKRVK